MGDGSGGRALQKTSQVGTAAGLGAGKWALVGGEVTQRQWMAVTQMMRLTANPNHLVVDTQSPYDKLLMVLAWLTDISVGWFLLVRLMKASMFMDRFKGDSWELDEKNVRDWVKAEAARQERARSI
jgi:hypothetical protein